jgi:hypothetical protein
MLYRRVPAVLAAIGLSASFFLYLPTAESKAVAFDGLSKMDKSENADGSKYIENLPHDFEFPTDGAGRLLLREYGAIFVARNGVVRPKKVFFDDEPDVQRFQRSVEIQQEQIGGIKIELQKPAMLALQKAVKDANKQGLSISPRGGDSARRGYNQTIELWKSRVEPGLTYWVGKGRLKATAATEIRKLPIRQQITEILRLEEAGIYFAKSLDKSIIYSVAPPGSSQHIAMLALDVKEFDDPHVRAILAENGWFQTVKSDLPHFTYLGVAESKLPGLGLWRIEIGDRHFWIPDISSSKPNIRASGRTYPN